MPRTPGPWKVLQGEADDDYIVADSLERTICEPNTGYDEDEKEYPDGTPTIQRAEARDNAAFIVLACNAHERLVESLREFVSWADKGEPHLPVVMEKARAVLQSLEPQR